MSTTAPTTTSLGGVVAGLLTTVVQAADPGLLSKAEAWVSHGFGTFAQHNPELVPVGIDLLAAGESLANTHGLSVVTDIFNTLLPIFANAPTAATVTSAPPPPATPAT